MADTKFTAGRLPVRHFENSYEVDCAGRVFSLERTVLRNNGITVRLPARERKLIPNINGYLQINLYRDGKHFSKYVHRLVAEAFNVEQSEGLEVNHLNGCKHDNRVENLEWVTRSQNNTHKYRELKRAHPMAGVRGAACNYSMSVEGVDPATGVVVAAFAAMKEAHRAGFKAPAISRCIDSETRTHRGLRWRKANLTNIP